MNIESILSSKFSDFWFLYLKIWNDIIDNFSCFSPYIFALIAYIKVYWNIVSLRKCMDRKVWLSKEKDSCKGSRRISKIMKKFSEDCHISFDNFFCQKCFYIMYICRRKIKMTFMSIEYYMKPKVMHKYL